MNIKGKTILFLCTNFYNYYKEIIGELYKLGANEVIFIEIRRRYEVYKNESMVLSFLSFLANPNWRNKYTKDIFSIIYRKNIDILFCVGDVPFSRCFINKLKEKNKDLKSFLFLWDKLSIRPVSRDLITQFDKAFSFDRDDCTLIGSHLQYLPNFYIADDYNVVSPVKYDLCCIATLNREALERAYIVRNLQIFCNQNNLKCFLYLKGEKYKYRGFIHLLVDWLMGRISKEKNTLIDTYKKYGYIYDDSLSIKEVEDIMHESSTIVDFGYPNRQGLTLNAIAAVSKGKKLITCNERIKEESFYNSNNIFVFDRKAPLFEKSFFSRPIVPVDMKELRLDNWLQYIFS